MKKFLSLVLSFALLTTLSFACAESNDPFGIQIIAGPEEESEPVSLDDIKLGADIDIPGYGTIKPISSEWVNIVNFNNYTSRVSGVEAEYLVLRFDITNLSGESRNYMDNFSMKVVYDDSYEYAGWILEYDYNRDENRTLPDGQYLTIDPFYVGHYLTGCTLPNYVMDSKAPLRMEISIDGNELTYNIRK